MAILIDGKMCEVEEEIAEEEGEEAEESTVRSDIADVADTYIREYFLRYALDIFGKDQELQELDDQRFVTSLAYFIPRLVEIEPSQTHRAALCYEPAKAVSNEDLRRTLIAYGGEFVENCDFENHAPYHIENLSQVLPDCYRIATFLDEVYWECCHKYTVVLSMKSELRNLPAIALGERTEDEDYSFFCADDGPEKRLLELCVPTFKEIVDVAKDYDITNVRETIAELSRVTEIYLSRWEER